MNALIDTHTHLYTEEFDADRELAVIRAVEAGVTRLFMPNIDDTTVEAMLKLCEAHDCCYPMIGFHPTSVDAGWKKRLEKVKGYLTSSSHRFYGIGEVGIDLYWDKTFREEQMIVFEEQVKWALEYDLPLIIHCREAYPELLEVLSGYKHTALRGIFHSFTGTSEDAERLLEYESFMLGINGVVTFKKSTLPEVLKNVPLKRVVLETDSPYLAPARRCSFPISARTRSFSGSRCRIRWRICCVSEPTAARRGRRSTGFLWTRTSPAIPAASPTSGLPGSASVSARRILFPSLPISTRACCAASFWVSGSRERKLGKGGRTFLKNPHPPSPKTFVMGWGMIAGFPARKVSGICFSLK